MQTGYRQPYAVAVGAGVDVQASVPWGEGHLSYSERRRGQVHLLSGERPKGDAIPSASRDRKRDTLYGGDGSDTATVDNTSTLKDLWAEIEQLLA